MQDTLKPDDDDNDDDELASGEASVMTVSCCSRPRMREKCFSTKFGSSIRVLHCLQVSFISARDLAGTRKSISSNNSPTTQTTGPASSFGLSSFSFS